MNIATCDAESAQQLMALCRQGRLYEVEAWIRAGKPVNVPANLRNSPLLVGIEQGFHSLVELLLRNGADTEANENALELAVKVKHPGITQLLIEHGADLNSVSARIVCCSGHLDLVRVFLDRGADLSRDNGFAHGLVETKKALLGIYRSYRDRIPWLQTQADIALRHCCWEGHIGGACRLLWAGANPRAKVPNLDENEEDPELWDTALHDAVFSSHLEILERIGVDPARDNPSELLHTAAFSARAEVIRYLVERGADINYRDGTGQTLLPKLFRTLQWNNEGVFAHSSLEASRTKDAIRVTIELGAKWQRGDAHATRLLRDAFYRESPYSLPSMLETFRKHGACSDDELVRLLDTPRMLKILERDLKPFVKMFPNWRKAKQRWEELEEKKRLHWPATGERLDSITLVDKHLKGEH